MELSFTKMNGAGNDFVVFDNRENQADLTDAQRAKLCDRHRGVGADGVLAIEKAEGEADLRFRYYNADGGEAEMCGNGARCYARYAARLLDSGKTSLTFETIAGDLSAEITGEEVTIAMSDPVDLELDPGVEIMGCDGKITSINTGVPHAVVFVSSVADADVLSWGAAIRHHGHFQPNGTNANFAEVLAPDHLKVRTFERGVEGETLACGTGVTAVALLHHLLTGAPSPIKVEVAGGDALTIGFEKSGDETFSNVTMTGPADFVFDGTITV